MVAQLHYPVVVEESLRLSKGRQMEQPINYHNLKCTMNEGSVDTIVSAIYLMMGGHSKNVGLDFAEVVRQFLRDLTVAEQRQFWNEFEARHSQKCPTDLTTINSPDISTFTERIDGIATIAGSVQ
jgi:hypothetical protein